MVRHSGVVFGFLDEVLGARPLIVKPREQGNPIHHIGDEDAIAVFRGVEQLILLGLAARRRRVFFLLIAQRDETIRFAPALRAVPELALSIGIGLWRTAPVGRFPFIDQS